MHCSPSKTTPAEGSQQQPCQGVQRLTVTTRTPLATSREEPTTAFKWWWWGCQHCCTRQSPFALQNSRISHLHTACWMVARMLESLGELNHYAAGKMVRVFSPDTWNSFPTVCLSQIQSNLKIINLLLIFNILICPMISSHLYLLIEEAQWYELNSNCSQNRNC